MLSNLRIFTVNHKKISSLHINVSVFVKLNVLQQLQLLYFPKGLLCMCTWGIYVYTYMCAHVYICMHAYVYTCVCISLSLAVLDR